MSLKMLYLRLVVLLPMTMIMHFAYGQSSLGIGVAEQAAPPSGGMWSNLFLMIRNWQVKFEQAAAHYLLTIEQNPTQIYILLGVSFVYGILHALGPGHGKAVIASYIVANDETLKRGIVLSFFSSLLQALSAIVIVGAVYYLLPGQFTQTSYWVIKLSFFLIMILGLLLLIRKTCQWWRWRQANSSRFDSLFENNNGLETIPSNTGFQATNGDAETTEHRFLDNSNFCETCGQAHIFSADMVHKTTNWKAAALAVIAVGLRPCAGALFIMSFVMIQNLFLLGALAVLAMALGTFITVSILASLAVKARDFTEKAFRNRGKKVQIYWAIEWLAALFIFMIGLLLVLS